MSEHAPKGPEQFHSPEHHQDNGEFKGKTTERHEESGESLPDVETIRSSVHKEALSGKDAQTETHSEGSSHSSKSHHITREHKQHMFDRTMSSVRKRLSPSEKVLSKVVHNKPVAAISSATEKTIARPKGMLVGGICAFVGSAYTYYMAKNYGYRYNLLVFFILFIAGYMITTLVELVLAIRTRKQH